MCKWIKIWLETVPFQKIEIGHRFKIPDDPNVYIKINNFSGTTALSHGWTVVCGGKLRVYLWPGSN